MPSSKKTRLEPSLLEKDLEIELQDLQNTLVVGNYFTNKKVWLQNLALGIIETNSPVLIIDTENYFDETWLQRLSQEALSKISFLDFSLEKVPGINLFQDLEGRPELESLVIDKFFSLIDYMYDLKQTGGPMFETYFKNSIKLLLANPDSGTNLGLLPKILQDSDYRSFKLAMCDDQDVIDFWEKEASVAGGEAALENMVPYITSKLSPFISDTFIKRVVLQEKTTLDFNPLIHGSKSLIIRLDPLKLSKNAISVLGIILLAKLELELQKTDKFSFNIILSNLKYVLNDSFLNLFERSKQNSELKIFCGLDYLNQLKINSKDYTEFFENNFINHIRFYSKSDNSTHKLNQNQAIFNSNSNQGRQETISATPDLPGIKNNQKLSDLLKNQAGLSIIEVDKELEALKKFNKK